jgi:glucose-fructose oxidoreductase
MKFNRRDFIRYSAFSGAYIGLGFCQPKSGNQNNQKSPNKKLGVALVGLGYYSSGLLAPALQETEHCYLAGIVTGSPEKIKSWQKNYHIKDKNVYSYENMHQIANNDEIDVIYIVVPTGLHAKYAVIAANTGKHVWCEKPMAMNVPECQSIIDACEKNKVFLSIGYRMQHEPNTQTVGKFAETKPYGKIQSLIAEAGYQGGGGSGWRFQKKLGGGALYDMGVYCINGIRYAVKEEPILVKSARQFTKRPDLFTEVDETTEFELEFASGIKAIGRTSVGEGYNQLKINAEKGWYQLSPMQTYNGVQGKTSDGKKLDIYIKNQQARQMDDDALAIMNKKSPLVPGIEGLKDIRIVNAIMESARSGKEVKIA